MSVTNDSLIQATATVVAARLTTSALAIAAGKPTVTGAQRLEDIFVDTFRTIEKALERIEIENLDK
jgi:hypothetical protein